MKKITLFILIAMYDALRSLPSALIKRLTAESTTFQYQVRVKVITDSRDFLSKLSAKHKGPSKITRQLESGSLLVVKAGSGNINIDFN